MSRTNGHHSTEPAEPAEDQATPLLHSPAEAAAQLGVSRQFIYTLMESGELRSLKLGSARRVRHQDLVELIDSRLEEAAS